MGKMKSKIKKVSFKSKIDGINRSQLRFIGLSGRDRSKIHGKDVEGFCFGSDSAHIEDVLHSIGCDLFGGTRYNITIQVQEIPDVKAKKKAAKKEIP
tara:strand:- start:1188 stop:1478 length:291 start_codon:yes stop_codon:yes gene_type:complete